MTHVQAVSIGLMLGHATGELVEYLRCTVGLAVNGLVIGSIRISEIGRSIDDCHRASGFLCGGQELRDQRRARAMRCSREKRQRTLVEHRQ
jgi:hypothetical protein